MISVAANLLAFLLAGVPAARLLRQESSFSRLSSASFLLGTALHVQMLLLLSCLGVRWSTLSLATSVLIANVLVLALNRRTLSRSQFVGCGVSAVAAGMVVVLPSQVALAAGIASVLFVAAVGAPRPGWRIDAVVVLLLVAIGVTLAGYTLFATLAPPAENDFLFIWGLKARVFLEHQGIDWSFLTNRWNDESHLDYPLFVPLTFDAVLLRDCWNDAALGLVYVALALASLVRLHLSFRRQDAPGRLAALGSLGVITYLASPWIGLADAFVVAYGGLGLLLFAEALLTGDTPDALFASVLLGCAAQSKNEGITLLVATTVGCLVVVRPLSRILLLIPAYCLAIPWLLIRIPLHAQTDLVEGHPLGRFELHRVIDIAGAIPHLPWTTAIAVVALALALILAVRELAARVLVLIVLALQSCAYLFAFLITPKDIVWHVHAAFERLVSHIAFPLVAVVLLALIESAAKLQPPVRLPTEE